PGAITPCREKLGVRSVFTPEEDVPIGSELGMMGRRKLANTIAERCSEQTILVRQLDEGDLRVFGVGETRVWIHVRQQLAGVLFLQLDESRLEIRDGLAQLRQPVGIRESFFLGRAARDVQVQVCVDSMQLELIQQVIQLL